MALLSRIAPVALCCIAAAGRLGRFVSYRKKCSKAVSLSVQGSSEVSEAGARNSTLTPPPAPAGLAILVPENTFETQDTAAAAASVSPRLPASPQQTVRAITRPSPSQDDETAAAPADLSCFQLYNDRLYLYSLSLFPGSTSTSSSSDLGTAPFGQAVTKRSKHVLCYKYSRTSLRALQEESERAAARAHMVAISRCYDYGVTYDPDLEGDYPSALTETTSVRFETGHVKQM